jgi:hypothetical protein
VDIFGCRLNGDHMDRPENSPHSNRFANQSDVSPSDAAALPGPTGREGSRLEGSEAAEPLAGQPRSEITGRHDAGSGANETVDGLTASEEAIRRGAEETPIDTREIELEDLPVFDRGQTLPKV